MKDILDQLTQSQLIDCITSFCNQMDLKLDVDNDPGLKQPTIFATHEFQGSFTVLNLPHPLRRPYRVTCVRTERSLVHFEVDAVSPRQAIGFCVNRTDGKDLVIEPVDQEFLEVQQESEWTAELSYPQG